MDKALYQRKLERRELYERGHVPIVPPGMAYAAREANKAFAARQAREKAIGETAFDLGANAGQIIAAEGL